MAYLLHPNAETPHDDVMIWRYMELPQFLMLLEEHSIYFTIRRELKDRWEFAMPRQMEASIASHFGPSASGNMISLFEEFPESIAVSCWHENTSESIAMWSLYTHEGPGIAIQTSIEKLKASLSAVPQDVYIGRVRYEDYDSNSHEILPQSELTPIRNVLQKRRCFEHEHEVRAFLHITPPFPDSPVPGQIFIYPYPKTGVSVRVDLKHLIERVVISPYFPLWAVPVIKRALSRSEISPLIENVERLFGTSEPEGIGLLALSKQSGTITV